MWYLIGSSFGGLVATLVAQRQPKSIHSLLLLAPAFDPIRIWTSNIDIKQWKNIGFINYFNSTTQCDEPIDYEFFHDLQSHSSYPIVTTCPITIIHGLHDDVVPIETSREYMRRLRLANKYPTLMIEVDDDHHLRKEKTLNTIKKIILDNQK
jgi:pimeloyl-ACP methyl ester carboxylesterase